jgi:putative sugar O-methyltransferase
MSEAAALKLTTPPRHSDAEIHAAMRASYQRAMHDLPEAHRSRVWDFYGASPIDQRLPPETWSRLRRQSALAHMGNGDGSGPARVAANSLQGRRILQTWELLKQEAGTEMAHRLVSDQIGEPVGVAHEGRVLEMADLHLAINALRISQQCDGYPPGIIFEVGGGYGGLAMKLKSLYPAATIAIFDLPEASAIQLAYLSRCFPTARIVTYDAYKADQSAALLESRPDFILLPGHMISYFPDQCADLAINLRSMQEMHKKVVGYYIAEFERVLRPGAAFYCVNRYQKIDTGEAIRIKEFPFDRRWEIAISRQVAHQDSTHELWLVRLSQPAAVGMAEQLAHLPPTTLRDVHRNPRLAGHAILRWIFGTHPLNEPGIPGYLRAAWIFAARRLRSILRTYRR